MNNWALGAVFAAACALSSAAADDVCSTDVDASSGTVLLQRGMRTGESLSSSILDTVGWNPETLVKVRDLLGESSLPAWAEAAKAALVKEAERRLDLPAGLRTGVKAGPWSVTKQGPSPPSPGTSRDYVTFSGYIWPCYVTCPEDKFGKDKCDKAWVQADGPCDQETGLPWSKHDGFLNPQNSDDLNAMIVMMDTVEIMSLAWWFVGDARYADVGARVMRAWFFDEATGMLPRLSFGGAVPGVYTGRAGAMIAPSFRLGTRLSDSVELLKTASASTFTEADRAAWVQWSTAWSNWVQNSEFGIINLRAVGNHATFLFSHKLAMARAVGNSSIILDTVAKLRLDFAGSLGSQIDPSGEMHHETARVSGATYSMMNVGGLFLLGEAVENACRGLDCSPPWDWSWQVPEGGGSGSWEVFENKASYCRYKGRGSTESLDACKASCSGVAECNGVVTRVKNGKLMGCYLKKCSGTFYEHRDFEPGANVWTSYHFVKGPAAGSGSVRQALDFLLPYAKGNKSWSEDFPKTTDGKEGSWRNLALPLRIASLKYREKSYEEDIAKVDTKGFFFNYRFESLLFPPLGALSLIEDGK